MPADRNLKRRRERRRLSSTPGYLTPSSRLLRRGGKLQKIADDFSSQLLNRTWKLYQVTEPFIRPQFQQDLKILKQSLHEFMKREDMPDINSNAAWMTEESATNLPFHALVIDLKNVDDLERPLFTGVLCNVQSQSDAMNTHGTWLPLFLTNGNASLKNLAMKFLEKMYRTRISPLHLSPLELSWCAALWAHGEVRMKNFKLKYLSPPGIRGLDYVTMTVLSTDINHLWESIHSVDSDELYEHEVQAFFTSLHQHILQLFCIKLEAFKLDEVSTSNMIIRHPGTIKVFSKKIVLHLLRHLTSIVVENIINEIV